MGRGSSKAGSTDGMTPKERERLIAVSNGDQAYKSYSFRNPRDPWGAAAARNEHSKEDPDIAATEVLKNVAERAGIAESFTFNLTTGTVGAKGYWIKMDTYQMASIQTGYGKDPNRTWIVNGHGEQKRFDTPLKALRYIKSRSNS